MGRREPATTGSNSAGNDGNREQKKPADRAGSKPRRDFRARIVRRTTATSRWLSGSSAGHLWRRLDAMDFINRGMLFAAVLFLCFVPFVIIVQALAGRNSATSLVRRFGLTPQAAADVSKILTSPSATSGAITGASYLLFVLGGVAAASAIQELYERAFELPPRGMRNAPRQLIWLGATLGLAALAAWAAPSIRDAGGPVLLAALAVPALTGLWWFTMWLLLAGRMHWRDLFPSALATAVCWLGMSVVFKLTMSSSITSNAAKYGTVGVMLSLMSFLIAIGVVIILGAVFGVVWRERKATPARTQ